MLNFYSFLIFAEEADKKTIKVLIEGVDEAKEHQEAKPYIIWEKFDKKLEEQKLKGIAVKSKMEGEILDALISKIVDIESKTRKLEILNIILIILFILNLLLFFLNKNKK